MKKALWFVAFALFAPALFAASSTADLSSSPARREKYEIEVKNPGITGRWVKSDANLYYVAQNRREGDVYREFGGCVEYGCEKTPRSRRAETRRTETTRKYNLSNPFFQPRAAGIVGMTDFSYTDETLKFTILPGSGIWENHEGKFTAKTLSATQNLKVGITDDVAILGLAKYAKEDLGIKWDTMPSPWAYDYNTGDGALDLWGIGLQWRFLNDSDWIASVSGVYQRKTDAATALVAEGKFGFKNDDTTIYGFGRLYNLNWDGGEGYGFGFVNQYGQMQYFSQKEDGKSSLWYEAGAGLFAALDENWSADVSGMYSDSEWYRQVSMKLSLAYQPWKNAALEIYGSLALWNDADKFEESSVIYWEPALTNLERVGTAAFTGFSQMSAGVVLTVSF